MSGSSWDSIGGQLELGRRCVVDRRAEWASTTKDLGSRPSSLFDSVIDAAVSRVVQLSTASGLWLGRVEDGRTDRRDSLNQLGGVYIGVKDADQDAVDQHLL